MTFGTFLLIVTILYILLTASFIIGLKLNKDKTYPAQDLFVSVVIAARNEEKNLPDCLNSLLNQSYPKDKYEIIIANDCSTDNTEKICLEFMQNHPNIKLVNVKEDPVLLGKANALANGIDSANGEIILITDADCIVPPTWIEQTVIRYGENIGLVGGFALQKASTPFEGMQSLDWAFILGMAVASAGYKYPLGSIGNNLSFRKSAYQEIGGYRKLKFSVTEDYILVQAIIGKKKWDYVYPMDPKHLVESKPCTNFKSLLRQKQRWGKGGLDMKPIGFLFMLIGFLMHLTPFIMLYWGGFVGASTALMLKFIADYAFLYNILKKLDKTKELRWFYWFELYFIIYVILLPFLVFFGGKVKWKGREF